LGSKPLIPETLFALIDAVGNDNASGEYYLTDIVGLAREQGLSATVVRCAEAETLGINSREELASAEAAYQQRARADALANGVSRDAIVGPYARLRPGTELSEGVKVGNFVEIKNAQVAEGAKVNHLTYIGDADIGPRANIGAGTVTCNYDGYFKHKTTIGADAFIGSSTMLVAPVKVGSGALTASGSVVTEDVPAGDMAIGRARQTNKAGLAAKLMDKLEAAKAKLKKGS